MIVQLPRFHEFMGSEDIWSEENTEFSKGDSPFKLLLFERMPFMGRSDRESLVDYFYPGDRSLADLVRNNEASGVDKFVGRRTRSCILFKRLLAAQLRAPYYPDGNAWDIYGCHGKLFWNFNEDTVQYVSIETWTRTILSSY